MYLLLCVLIILIVLKSSLYNVYAKVEKPDFHGILTFNTICYAVAMIIALFYGIEKEVSVSTVICAVFYALDACLLHGLSVYSMKIGPMGPSALISMYGMIIPAISGPIFWGEPFGVLQFSGVCLILLSMWLLSNSSSEDKKVNKKWIFVISVVFFLSGFAGVLEKIHQSTDGRDEKSMFLIIAYLTMFAVSFVCKCIASRNGRKLIAPKKSVPTAIGSGLILGIYTFISLTLAGAMNSAVYFPVSNGGALILTVIASILVFGEKCTKKQVAGILSGLVAVVMLSL